MATRKLHQWRLSLTKKARSIEAEPSRPNTDDIDGAPQVDSDFVAIFRRPPERLLPKMQRMSFAFTAPEPDETTNDHCLCADFLKQLVKAARGQQFAHRFFEMSLDWNVSCCHFGGFLRSQLHKDSLGRNDVEFPTYEERAHWIEFYFTPLKEPVDGEMLFVGTKAVEQNGGHSIWFMLAPLIDDREAQHLRPPSKLRFTWDHPKQEPAQLQIRRWIEECNEHKSCDTHRMYFLPARVIDVGSSAFPKLRLHVSQAQDKAHFVTLSYCWGGYEGIRLIESNLDSFKQGIDEEILPLTYADAVFLTRRLGIRYLWIDALCIIQDSSTDWEEQSAMMDEVYGNSYLTICASSAPDPSHGFLKQRDDRGFTHVYCGSLSHEQKSHPVFLTPLQRSESINLHNPYIGALRKDPLTSRAWAVQERLLSRRALYFTDTLMIWQCRQITHQDDGVSTAPQPGLNLRDATSSLSSWYVVVQTYSYCTLSKPTDRLPAILGYARAFSLANNQTDYLAEHWVDGLFESLVWMGNSKGRNVRHQAPSWSWASMNGEVAFPFDVFVNFTPIAELLEHNATQPWAQRAGSSLQAKLRIRALVASGTTFHAPRHDGDDANYQVKLDSFPHIRLKITIFLDDELPDGSQVVLAILLKRRELSESTFDRYRGLFLQKIDMNELTLRRIGMFWMDEDSPRVGQDVFSRKVITLV